MSCALLHNSENAASYSGVWSAEAAVQGACSCRGPEQGSTGSGAMPTNRNSPLWHFLSPCSSLSPEAARNYAVKFLLCCNIIMIIKDGSAMVRLFYEDTLNSDDG